VAGVYEFHVAGLVGPVVRSALPELSTHAGARLSVLSGTVNGPEDIDDLLQRLSDHGLVATHILIARETRWHQAGSLAHSAPRQS